MTKADLINVIAEKGEYTKKDADKALATVISAISDSLAKGEKIQLIGFGTFEVRERAAKDSKNPRTGEIIHCEAKKAPAFKAGKALKDAVNQK
ncbi:MAG: HU family DNA-binding protein [Oscillospiraceae bacterium]|nr:HU family DNA-binding protein [Oscillospiraceae bacterium]